MTADRRSPRLGDHLAAGASMVGLLGFLGAVGYACIAPVYHAFYSQLGLRPADVGQNRESMLIYPAFLIVVLVLSAMVFVVAGLGLAVAVLPVFSTDRGKVVLSTAEFRKGFSAAVLVLLSGAFYFLISGVVGEEGFPGGVGWIAGAFAVTPVFVAFTFGWTRSRRVRSSFLAGAALVGAVILGVSSLSLAAAAERAGQSLLDDGSCKPAEGTEILRFTGVVEGGDIGMFARAVDRGSDPLSIGGRRVLTLGGNAAGEWVVVPDVEACEKNETPRPAVLFASRDRYVITRSAAVDQPLLMPDHSRMG